MAQAVQADGEGALIQEASSARGVAGMHGTPALVVMGEAVDAGRQGREESAFADGGGRAVNNEDIDIQLDEEVNGSNNRGECDNSRTQL